MTNHDRGLEAALSATQADTETAGSAAGAVTRELKKAHTAAVTGQVRELRRALAAAEVQARELAESVARAKHARPKQSGTATRVATRVDIEAARRWSASWSMAGTPTG